MTTKADTLVTGATGFAGSHMVDHLLDAGHRVRVLVRRTSNLRFVPAGRVETVTADVRDPDSLRTLVDGIRDVYHFSGLTRARSSEAYFRVNCEGTARLASVWLEQNHDARRFVFISSLAASGPAPDAAHPRLETDRPAPLSAYGKSKLAAETYLTETIAGRVQVLMLRPPAVYGPRDEATLTLFRWIRRGILPLPGPRVGRLSLAYGPELARAAYELAESGASGVYHISDGEYYSWEEVGVAIADVLGRQVRQVPVASWVVRFAGELGEWAGRLTGVLPVINRAKVDDIRQPFWTCSLQKARNQGFEPHVLMKDGMVRTVRWYRTAGWL